MGDLFAILEGLILVPLVWYLVISHSRHEKQMADTNERIDHWARRANSWQNDANAAKQQVAELTLRLDEARKIAGLDKPATEAKS